MKYTNFAGVNGAGKSSLYSIFKSELDLGARINTDEIVGKNWRDEKLQIHAARKAIEIRKNPSLSKKIVIILKIFINKLKNHFSWKNHLA